MNFKKLYIARPGGIIPSHPRDNYQFKEKLMISVTKLFGLLLPSMAITSAELAKAMLKLLKVGSDKVILENKDLHRLL